MFTVTPIGFIKNDRSGIEDDHWGEVVSEIILDPSFGEQSILGLQDFSHLEIIFLFDQVKKDEIEFKAGHPRNNESWPLVGIFAQRAKNRPNRIGLTTAELVGVEGNVIKVRGLDAIEGTPVLDIKPVMKEFLPKGGVRQPGWSNELMKDYWK